ncbi:tetratricopeptide repeat protein [Flavobacteriaceae bacterium R38]|nr:tetratricopeptide repeat protein [Flavobacteriaceae bacterium R38]
MNLSFLNRIFLFIVFISIICSCEEKSIPINIDSVTDVEINDSIVVYLDMSRDESEVDQQLLLAKKAYKMATENKRDSLRNIASLRLTYIYYSNEDNDAFLKQNKRSLLLAASSNDSSSIARSYGYFGNYYLREGKNDSAYYYFYKSEKTYSRLPNRSVNRGRMLLNMAITQKNEKDFIGGEVTTIEAIRFIPESGEERMLSSAYNNLGIISNQLENYDKAIEYHQKAFQLRKKIRNQRLEVGSLYNMAQVYVNKKEYREAIKTYYKALSYKEVLSTRPLTNVNLLENIAHAKFLNGNNKELPDSYLSSLKVRDSLGSIAGSIESNIHLAEYYSSQEDTLTALNYARKARDLAEESKNYGDMLEPLLLLSKLNKGKEGSTSSLRYISISDSLQKAERAIRNKFARIRFDTDIIEQENIKITKQVTLLTWVTLIVFTFSTLLYFIIREKARNRKLKFEQIQQKSNEEIYNLMISQQRKLEEGRQQEKQRVSQELHDGVLSKLFGTRLSLDSINTKSDSQAVETRSRYLNELKSIEQEIRQISHDLNAEIFDVNLGYTEVITNLIDAQMSINDQVKYEFKNDTSINWEGVSNKVKIHFYRILQESLQNINKHANASNIIIGFKQVDDKIEFDIIDDGVGFDNSKSKKGIGLKNIKTRIKELNGKLIFTTSKGQGTNINISVAI